MSLSDDKQAKIIDAFNTTSRYLDDILNVDNIQFDNMVRQVYPLGRQINTANTSDIETPFWISMCPFLTILSLPRFKKNVTILISNCQFLF